MKCPNPKFVWPHGNIMAVPCGKCLVCLSNKRQDWAFRLMQEYKVSKSSFFVTLTYSEKYYPHTHGVSKRHVQLFLKRLRHITPNIRYYAVGEYGTLTGRAHYHIIIFNSDEKAIRETWTLRNKVTNKIEPIGLVHIGKVTEKSVQYVLKYVVQRDQSPKNLNKSFSLMSRGYGLGAHYLTDKMVKWHRDNNAVYTVTYGEKGRLPRFYKEKIWPNSSWSDWAVRRENVFKNARKEADKRDKYNLEIIRRAGYKDPEAARKAMQDAMAAKILQKVKYSQKI